MPSIKLLALIVLYLLWIHFKTPNDIFNKHLYKDRSPTYEELFITFSIHIVIIIETDLMLSFTFRVQTFSSNFLTEIRGEKKTCHWNEVVTLNHSLDSVLTLLFNKWIEIDFDDDERTFSFCHTIHVAMACYVFRTVNGVFWGWWKRSQTFPQCEYFNYNNHIEFHEQ